MALCESYQRYFGNGWKTNKYRQLSFQNVEVALCESQFESVGVMFDFAKKQGANSIAGRRIFAVSEIC